MSAQQITQEEFEKIERYLRNELSDSELRDFEKSMENDARLSNAVDKLSIEISAIEEAGFRESLNEFHSQLNDHNHTGKIHHLEQPTTAKFPRWAIAASLILLLGLGIYFSMQNNSPEKLYAAHFSPDPGLSTPMSTTDNYAFYRGMVDYKQGKYTEALNQWDQLLKTKPNNDSLNFFIGVSLMSLNRVAEAVPHLNKVVTSNESAFKNESHYYIGLSLLKQGEIEKSASALRKSDLSEAKILLNKLNDM